MTATSPGDLTWLLEHLVTTVDRVRQVVILAADGLTLAHSPGLSQEDADRLAALASGLQSLARGAGQAFAGGEVRQTIIEMDAALLFITAAGEAPAWPCWLRRTPTRGWSRTRWPSWSSGWASTWWRIRGFPRGTPLRGEPEP
jgi:predicted regulator of Ras-like GTPase activity (Roadblock/LC7/MglB family)